jgi:hypothetical protein
MIWSFIEQFFWKCLKDLQAWVGIVGLLLAAVNGVTGATWIFPTWGWLLVAFAGALSMAIRADWHAYRDRTATPSPDMPLIDVVKRIVGSDDILVGDNCSKTGEALLTIRERAHLAEISVWARRDALTDDMKLYPLAPIASEYWDSFGIDYLRFTDDHKGESKRVRGAPGQQRVPNAVTTTVHLVQISDVVYRDFWFCTYEVERRWPKPKRRVQLRWPIHMSFDARG